LLVAAGFVAPVYAHANLIRSDPPANSIIPISPNQVTLYFTEQVEPKLSGAAVYDSSGKEVDTGYSVNQSDATVLTVTLQPLPPGVYTVSWHAISAVDGHHTSGSFSFGVGNVTIPTQSNNNAAPYIFPSALEVIERWLNLLADIIFLGGSIFVLAVWRPTLSSVGRIASQEHQRRVSRRLAKLLASSAILALVATVLLLIVQSTAAASSTSFYAVMGTVLTILTSTRIGEYWMFRMGIVALALGTSIIILRRLGRPTRAWILALIVGLGLSLSTSITSHNAAATVYYPPINLLSDLVHLVSVGAWIGGLAYLGVTILSLSGPVSRKSKVPAELLRRFSSIAVICVGSIGTTGTYSLLVEVGSLSALFSTVYGRLLLLKITLFAPMIVFGAFNQFIVYDRIIASKCKTVRTRQQRPAPWIGRLALSIRTEMTLGVALLLIVGLLTASAPVAQAPSAAPSYQPKPFVVHGYSDQGVNVTMKIFPYQAGDNHFEIDFTNSDGSTISDIRSAFVKFTYLDKNIGVSIANSTASGQGIYTLDGTYLSFSGNWRAEVWARRSEGYDVIAPFHLNVPTISLRFSELPLSSDSNPYGITVDRAGTVWFAETGSGNIASYVPLRGTFNEYSLPQAGSKPFYITTNNGTVWFTETQYNQIMKFQPSTSAFKAYPLPTSGAVPGGIAVDRFGNIWFTEEIADKIGRLQPSTGNIVEFQIPTADSIPIQITTDPSGTLWFTESKSGKIAMMDPSSSVITEFQPRTGTLLGPTGITVSPDGLIWFTEHAGNRITKFDPHTKTFHSYSIPTAQAFPFGIAYHTDRLWFVEHIANAVGSLDVATGVFSSFSIPNNSSDAQLLTIDEGGNVWFTLPASNTLGLLTPTTSTLELVTSPGDPGFGQLAVVATILIVAATIAALFLGQRRMKRRARKL
jgi:streptogramin lyase/putative copper export protein/methionine-rich copper-binding protein CopC